MSGYSGVMDLVLAILPWWILQAVQLGSQEKVGIAVAMSMGVFAACSAFVKAAALPELASSDFPCESSSLWPPAPCPLEEKGRICLCADGDKTPACR